MNSASDNDQTSSSQLQETITLFVDSASNIDQTPSIFIHNTTVSTVDSAPNLGQTSSTPVRQTAGSVVDSVPDIVPTSSIPVQHTADSTADSVSDVDQTSPNQEMFTISSNDDPGACVPETSDPTFVIDHDFFFPEDHQVTITVDETLFPNLHNATSIPGEHADYMSKICQAPSIDHHDAPSYSFQLLQTVPLTDDQSPDLLEEPQLVPSATLAHDEMTNLSRPQDLPQDKKERKGKELECYCEGKEE